MALDFSSCAIIASFLVKRQAADYGLADPCVFIEGEPEAGVRASALGKACVKVILLAGGEGVGMEALSWNTTLEA